MDFFNWFFFVLFFNIKYLFIFFIDFFLILDILLLSYNIDIYLELWFLLSYN